jgi:hypothetical protein
MDAADLAHAAGADLGDDLVVSECLTDHETGRFSIVPHWPLLSVR